MKKTLAILAFALVILLCCVSCGSKEVTITLPKVMKDGQQVETNWCLNSFSGLTVGASDIVVIKGLGAGQTYKPNGDVTLYAYDHN